MGQITISHQLLKCILLLAANHLQTYDTMADFTISHQIYPTFVTAINMYHYTNF